MWLNLQSGGGDALYLFLAIPLVAVEACLRAVGVQAVVFLQSIGNLPKLLAIAQPCTLDLRLSR